MHGCEIAYMYAYEAICLGKGGVEGVKEGERRGGREEGEGGGEGGERGGREGGEGEREREERREGTYSLHEQVGNVDMVEQRELLRKGVGDHRLEHLGGTWGLLRKPPVTLQNDTTSLVPSPSHPSFYYYTAVDRKVRGAR